FSLHDALPIYPSFPNRTILVQLSERRPKGFTMQAVRGVYSYSRHAKSPRQCRGLFFYSLRGQDLNLRPSGYEPDELPNCSTPRRVITLYTPRKWNANWRFSS